MDTSQDPTKSGSEGAVVGDHDVDTGTRLRRTLGLTATVSPENTTTALPDPYEESCLEENSETLNDDSLIKLAKHTYQKLFCNAGSTKKLRPTPIQLQSWPILKLASTKASSRQTKHNLIGISTTGSGKTLSYAIPMIDSCMMAKGELSTRCVHGLVIVPTRELALQVSKVLKVVSKSANKLLGRSNKIIAMAIYGGVNREEQIDSLCKNSLYILAATPLRLIDILGIGIKDGNGNQSVPNERVQGLFETTRYLVIDEADQMATKSDLSQQVDQILDFLRKKCDMLDRRCLYSATLSQKAIAKCNDWIDPPRVTIKFNIATVGLANAKNSAKASENTDDSRKAATDIGSLDLSTIPSRITQTLHVCSNHKKPKKLMTTISKIYKEEKGKGNRRRRGLLIIFFGRIKTLQYVHDLLKKEEINGVVLHSQMNQQKREAQLNLFRSGKCPILLATDIAARGIHVKNVEYVINYDFPSSLEQYIHRCGRAGRNEVNGGTRGEQNEQTSNATVYSFFNRELAPMAKSMVELLRLCKAWVDPNLIALVPGAMNEGGGESKRKRRKRKKDNIDGPTTDDGSKAKKLKNSKEDGQDSEDAFPELVQNRIVLKRASHVTYSDSDDDNET